MVCSPESPAPLPAGTLLLWTRGCGETSAEDPRTPLQPLRSTQPPGRMAWAVRPALRDESPGDCCTPWALKWPHTLDASAQQVLVHPCLLGL